MGGTNGLPRSLAERVAAEEAEKNYQARLECWHHEVELSTSVSETLTIYSCTFRELADRRSGQSFANARSSVTRRTYVDTFLLSYMFGIPG